MIDPVSVMSEAPGAGDPEVGDLGVVGVVDDHVVGLEVAVDDAAAVGEARGLEDLDRDVDRPDRLDRRLARGSAA